VGLVVKNIDALRSQAARQPHQPPRTPTRNTSLPTRAERGRPTNSSFQTLPKNTIRPAGKNDTIDRIWYKQSAIGVRPGSLAKVLKQCRPIGYSRGGEENKRQLVSSLSEGRKATWKMQLRARRRMKCNRNLSMRCGRNQRRQKDRKEKTGPFLN